MQRSLEGDLVDSVELLEHSANLALAALFLVRPFTCGPVCASGLVNMVARARCRTPLQRYAWLTKSGHAL